MNAPAVDVGRIALAGELTIQNVAAARARLLDALGDSDAVVVDLAEVGEFDSAGLQLLVAARKSADAAGKRLQFANPSPVVVDVLEFLAMRDAFPWAAGEGPR